MDSTRSILHPAQAFFLAKPYTSTLEDLYKFILWDLIARQVLSFKVKTYKPHPRDRYTRSAWHVSTGKHIVGYQPLPFEKAILDIFIQYPDSMIRFKGWAKFLYKTSPTSGAFKRKFLRPTGLLKELVVYGPVSKYSPLHLLNADGRRFAQHLRFYLKEFDKKIANGYLLTHPTEALEHLINLRSNVFLLSSESLSSFSIYRKKYRENPAILEVKSDEEEELYHLFLLSEEFDDFWDNQAFFDKNFETHFAPDRGMKTETVDSGWMVARPSGQVW
ncbi:hypothetical protein N9933_00035 [bacterium]|nr:hypothetical protein [bacterium]